MIFSVPGQTKPWAFHGAKHKPCAKSASVSVMESFRKLTSLNSRLFAVTASGQLLKEISVHSSLLGDL